MKVTLDWSKIDNDKDFQRLSNHLFLIECNRTYFTPSSPYIGADGGWDGRYDGEHGQEKGLFSIQAKWTLKNYNDAETALRSELKKEIDKAVDQRVDHLILTTNAELRVGNITELEALKPSKLKTLQVWHRETLTLKLYEQPFLCFFYFNNPQFPAFRPPELYFADDKDKLFLPSLIGKDDEVQNFITQVMTDGNSIVIKHAPGGHGKTHFLHEAAIHIDSEFDDYQVWCVNPNLRPLTEAFQNELVEGRNYILILDDADRYLTDLQHLIGYAKSEPSIKLVLGSRSAGLPLVEQELNSQRVSNYDTSELAPLEKPDLIKLLLLASGKKKIERAEEIIDQLDQMPYLVAQYGKRLKGNFSEADIENINATLTRLVADDANNRLNDFLPRPHDAGQLLTHLAAIVPFHETDKTIAQLGEIIEQTPRVIRQCIQELLKGKILRHIGKTIRFYPDMAGDLYLANQINENPEYVDTILTKWFGDLPEQIIANLASAVPYDESQAIRRVLSKLVRSWIDEAETEPRYYHVGKLEWLERIIRFVPEDGLNLMYTYMEIHRESPDKYRSPQLDHYGPLLNILGGMPQFNLEALEFIKQAMALKLESTYTNYQSSDLVRRMVRPSSNSISLIEDLVSKILQAIQSECVIDIDVALAIDVASELLAGAHEWTHSTPREVSIGARPLRDIPEVQELRNKGIKIIYTLLNNVKYMTAAFEIADHIGDINFGIGPDPIPLAQRIKEDRETVVVELAKINLNELPLHTLSKLEDLLMHWWLTDTEGTEKSIDIIRRISKAPIYLLMRHYIPSRYIVYDFDELCRRIPMENKWKWWVHHDGERAWQPNEEELKVLAEKLNQTYSTCDQLKGFFNEAEALLDEINPQYNPPILRFWIDLNPSLFLEYLETHEWDKIPVIFQGYFSASIAKYKPDHILEKCEEIQKKSTSISWDELRDFMNLVIDNNVPHDDVKACFSSIAQNANTTIRAALLHRTSFYFQKLADPDSYCKLIIESTHGSLDEEYIDKLALALHSLRQKDRWTLSNLDLLIELRSKLRPLLIDVQQIDFDANELIYFCCGTEVNEYIELIEERIKCAINEEGEKVSRSEFEAIPYDGFSGLKNAILTQEDLGKILRKVTEWRREYPSFYYCLKYVLKSLVEVKRHEPHKTDLLRQQFILWIRDELKKEDVDIFEDIIFIIELGDFYYFDDEILLQLLIVGNKVGSFDKAKSKFNSLLEFGTMSSAVGEVPPALIDKKSLCERLKEKAPHGRVKSFLQEQIYYIDRMITNHMDEQDEYLNPR